MVHGAQNETLPRPKSEQVSLRLNQTLAIPQTSITHLSSYVTARPMLQQISYIRGHIVKALKLCRLESHGS